MAIISTPLAMLRHEFGERANYEEVQKMKQEVFLENLKKEAFPLPVFVVREHGGFLNTHAHDYEVKALVTEGQIDIVINGIKNTYLAGDAFHLLPSQAHAESYGGKGVKYLASRKGGVLQEELGLEVEGEQGAP